MTRTQIMSKPPLKNLFTPLRDKGGCNSGRNPPSVYNFPERGSSDTPNQPELITFEWVIPLTPVNCFDGEPGNSFLG